MTNVKDEIAKNLAFYRKKSKFTQKKLAEKIGVKDNTISQWENGTNSIDIELLFKICDILGISINNMFGTYSNSGMTLSKAESILLDKFNVLNNLGKAKLIDYADDLVLSKKYIQ